MHAKQRRTGVQSYKRAMEVEQRLLIGKFLTKQCDKITSWLIVQTQTVY